MEKRWSKDSRDGSFVFIISNLISNRITVGKRRASSYPLFYIAKKLEDANKSATLRLTLQSWYNKMTVSDD